MKFITLELTPLTAEDTDYQSEVVRLNPLSIMFLFPYEDKTALQLISGQVFLCSKPTEEIEAMIR